VSNLIRNTKDFDLQTLTLVTSTGLIDLRFLMVELSYNEDLFNNSVTGYLMIAETSGLIEKLSLMGTEFLRLILKKQSDNSFIIDKTFRIYKAGKRKLGGTMESESYCLYFCSEEMMLSEQYKINKSYPNTKISDIVKDICTNYLKIPESKLEIDETYGPYDFIIPYLKPFDAINWLSTYARPVGNIPGSDMVFFQNKDKFLYKSLQSLIYANPYDSYRYDPKNTVKVHDTDMSEQMTNAITYEILDSFDTLNATNSGMFANKLISVDILTRSKKITKFNYDEYKNEANDLNPYGLNNGYTNRFGDMMTDTSEACLKLVFSNFDDAKVVGQANTAHNIWAETYIPYRTAQIQLANYHRLRLSVPGDPNLTVGSVIEFNLLSRDPLNKEPEMYYSGNYLVTATRHMISTTSYKTVIEIAKGSVPSPFAAATSNDILGTNKQ
jgi:hypothetical protein